MAGETRVLKWTIPVDDVPHEGGAHPVHVDCVATDYENVQLWTHSKTDVSDHLYQVYATGQPVPNKAVYVGTALALNGGLVWHVFDVTDVYSSDSRPQAPRIRTAPRGY